MNGLKMFNKVPDFAWRIRIRSSNSEIEKFQNSIQTIFFRIQIRQTKLELCQIFETIHL